MAADAASPVAVVEAIYAALAERDLDRLVELISPDMVLTQDPSLPWGGAYVGHDGFATFGLTLTSTIDSKVTVSAVFEADGDVIEMGRTAGTVVATGQPFDVAEVHRWTIRDGRAVTAHFSIDTPAMLAALGAGPVS